MANEQRKREMQAANEMGLHVNAKNTWRDVSTLVEYELRVRRLRAKDNLAILMRKISDRARDVAIHLELGEAPVSLVGSDLAAVEAQRTEIITMERTIDLIVHTRQELREREEASVRAAVANDRVWTSKA